MATSKSTSPAISPIASWYVYILECRDGTYYTGITTDIERRLHEHNHSPKGAKYTRARRPVTLRYYKNCTSKSDALKTEITIKKMTRRQKIQLLHSHPAPTQGSQT
jgi:putative endonuclease